MTFDVRPYQDYYLAEEGGGDDTAILDAPVYDAEDETAETLLFDVRRHQYYNHYNSDFADSSIRSWSDDSSMGGASFMSASFRSNGGGGGGGSQRFRSSSQLLGTTTTPSSSEDSFLYLDDLLDQDDDSLRTTSQPIQFAPSSTTSYNSTAGTTSQQQQRRRMTLARIRELSGSEEDLVSLAAAAQQQQQQDDEELFGDRDSFSMNRHRIANNPQRQMSYTSLFTNSTTSLEVPVNDLIGMIHEHDDDDDDDSGDDDDDHDHELHNTIDIEDSFRRNREQFGTRASPRQPQARGAPPFSSTAAATTTISTTINDMMTNTFDTEDSFRVNRQRLGTQQQEGGGPPAPAPAPLPSNHNNNNNNNRLDLFDNEDSFRVNRRRFGTRLSRPRGGGGQPLPNQQQQQYQQGTYRPGESSPFHLGGGEYANFNTNDDSDAETVMSNTSSILDLSVRSTTNINNNMDMSLRSATTMDASLRVEDLVQTPRRLQQQQQQQQQQRHYRPPRGFLAGGSSSGSIALSSLNTDGSSTLEGLFEDSLTLRRNTNTTLLSSPSGGGRRRNYYLGGTNAASGGRRRNGSRMLSSPGTSTNTLNSILDREDSLGLARFRGIAMSTRGARRGGGGDDDDVGYGYDATEEEEEDTTNNDDDDEDANDSWTQDLSSTRSIVVPLAGQTNDCRISLLSATSPAGTNAGAAASSALDSGTTNTTTDAGGAIAGRQPFDTSASSFGATLAL
mmetsp:Transcript_30831/g.47603  ORF Transcript_30831/g.47603 Transcript_30831/m.47603 type:complete len:730 (+) Transcript_30831:200-2389(+)|eukprot:CAMPEP_0117024500 /NCGR_PEP_ID=MMETSP0472-20121206/18190_1 /TAXON_ID=693140 ORGANISM="Tiarina fusus, Strain LIS" /NCGR_SAMPLE_ID=MMETSP0472 /ASSEMBLY_ACC=CAM_ASM_000603 /LENGTH=729 /DNA_ID=CAMNT_0004730951 /DNA_START=177 /DNA_END=2366 /DNA_ORIENTATION=-